MSRNVFDTNPISSPDERDWEDTEKSVTPPPSNVIHKVFLALERAGLTVGQAIDSVNQMQNAGIIFLERE